MAVFINYRREDSDGETRAIYNRFAEETDEHNLFLDVEAIGAGEKWKARIDDMMERVRAVVVVIGPRWLDVMNARAAGGAFDAVRSEIAAGLNKPGVHVIPVLVNGARLPASSMLPDDIRGLTDVNAIEVRGSAWKSDIARLVKTLREAGALPTSRRRWAMRAAAALATCVTLAIVAILTALRVTVPDVPPDMSILHARRLIESHGLKFQLGDHGQRPDYTNRKVNLVRHEINKKEIEEISRQDPGKQLKEVLKQEPEAGSWRLRGQNVVVHFRLIEPYRLICRKGGSFDSVPDDNLFRIDKYPVSLHPDAVPVALKMSPGSCGWLTDPLKDKEAHALRPLGFANELQERFRKAPGGLLAFCALSQYSDDNKVSPRLVAVSVHDFLRPDDVGKPVQRITDYVCIESDM